MATDDDAVVTEAIKVGKKAKVGSAAQVMMYFAIAPHDRPQYNVVVDTLERRYNGTHVYAPVGVTMSRWPGFPGNDPNVNTTAYALDSFKSMWLLSNT